MIRLLLPVLLALLVAAPRAAFPQATGEAPPVTPQLAPARPLPIDPVVTRGTLPNGLQYFIRQNDRPADRVLLRLAVDAGSVYEDDDQRGLAHVLEHMAFNGTANFDPGELVSFFELAGARFGPHVNAYTSFDETVYMLQVATDQPGLLEKGLLALSDFAGRITLAPEEVDKERGVVVEEWRLRLGSSTRILEQQAPVLFHDSLYAERLPIGTPEVLRNFPVERLRDFYDTWYRPDRMAVVVVGDIDPQAIEQQVKDLFGALEARRPPDPLPNRAVPPHDTTLVSVASDPEAQASTVTVLRKGPPPPQETVGDYRQGLVRRLMYQMLNLRFDEIARRADAPFLAAGAGSQDLTHTTTAVTLSARVEGGEIGEGLGALILEARRAREFGFSDSELDRAKKSLAALYERAYAERDKSESAGYAREYVSHFLTGEPIPGIEMEYEMSRAMLPGITQEEVTDAARELLQEGSRVVLAAAPEKEAVELPGEADIRQVLAQAAKAPLEPWTDSTAGRELLADPPAPGRVTGTRVIEPLGVTVLTLSNGAEVWLKPTDFQNDQVLIGSIALGGASTAPRADYLDTVLSASLVNIAGVGGFTPPELRKLLAGRLAGVSASVDLSTHGVQGLARPQDLETGLQLLHLYFTRPGGDEAGFGLMKRQLLALLANREENPAAQFADRLRQLNTSHHYTSEPMTPARIEALRLPVMQQAYARLFDNAADFTFFLVGAFDVAKMTPLVATYIGSLPSTGKNTSTFEPLDLRFPESVDRIKVTQGREPKSETVITFFADAGNAVRQTVLADAVASILQVRLREILREDLGGTYSVSATYSNTLPDLGYGTIAINFGSSPENAGKLTSEVLAEVTRLRKEGPSADDCAKVRAQEIQQLETALRQNGYWLNALQSTEVLGRDPLVLLEQRERIADITPEHVGEAMRRYLPLDRYTVGTLLPGPTTTR